MFCLLPLLPRPLLAWFCILSCKHCKHTGKHYSHSTNWVVTDASCSCSWPTRSSVGSLEHILSSGLNMPNSLRFVPLSFLLIHRHNDVVFVFFKRHLPSSRIEPSGLWCGGGVGGGGAAGPATGIAWSLEKWLIVQSTPILYKCRYHPRHFDP